MDRGARHAAAELERRHDAADRGPGNSGPTVANTTVTNVPGPTDPIFFRGARLLRAAGLGPLIGGLNLCHVVASYNGTLSISATADRDALPDPARYAHRMDNAFQELLAAAG